MLFISLRQYRYIVVAAEHGNLTSAAAALGVSQPAVSAALAAIEAHFNRTVFVRQHGSGVTLTSFGRDLVRGARQILAQANHLERLTDETGPLRGQLSFGCYNDVAPHYVPALLQRFAQKHPSVAVSFRSIDFESLSEQLESGAIDLALTYDVGLSAAIERTTLLELLPRAIVAANHPLAKQSVVSLKELAAYPLVLADEPLSREHILSLFARKGIDVPNKVHGGSLEFLRGLVANGHGVAVLYARPKVDRSYDGKKIVGLEIADPLPRHPIVLGRLKNSSPNRAAQEFFNFTLETFKSQSRLSRDARK